MPTGGTGSIVGVSSLKAYYKSVKSFFAQSASQREWMS